MRALISGCLLALFFAVVLTPLVRRLALRLRALDSFSARKLLAPPVTPRLGGLAIAGAFYLTLLLLWLWGSVLTRATLSSDTPVFGILLGGLPILMVGAVDDVRGLRALPKLLCEIAVAIFLYAIGLRIELANPAHFGPAASVLMPAMSVVLTVAWLVGVTNAMNLIDGLDGLAAGVALFAMGTTAVAALLRGDLLLGLLAVVLSGALIGFLVFNWSPASIFMGDTGSLFLGYLLSTTAIWSVRKAATAVLVVLPVVALGLPLLDISLTVSRRLLAGRSILQADRDHVHHRLLGRGLEVRRAVLFLYAVCAVFSGLALLMLLGGATTARIALSAAIVFALGLGYFLGYLRRGRDGLGRAYSDRRQTKAILLSISRLEAALKSCTSTDEIRLRLREFSALLPHAVELVLSTEAAPPEAENAPPTSLPVGSGQQVFGRLVVEVPSAQLSSDERTLLQLLSDLVGQTLGRLASSTDAGG